MSTTLWKAGGALHPAFEKLNRCLESDWFLLPHELTLQRGHARALAAAGILSAAEHAAIGAALERVEREFGAAACPKSPAEDLHTFIELKLTEYAGDAGRKIHTGRSRNDQVATLIRLYAAESGQQVAGRLRATSVALCRRAESWADLALPLHTHQQFAAPGSAGHWALRFAVAFERCRRRLEFCIREWWRYCPLGSGAVAGSSIPLDRRIQASDLGFDGPGRNALDATSTRDESVELLAIGTQIGLHAQSFATDVILFCQTPLAWVKYPAEFGTGSSMMPNKLNPDAMELLRGECNAVFAAHTEAVSLLKGLPSGYNRDLQCIKPVLRRGVETLINCLDMLGAFIERLEFDSERIAAALPLGHMDATLRMEQRVLAGAPLRQAHHETAAELAARPPTPAAEVAACIGQYRTLGSASPAETRRVAAELLSELSAGEP
jgi:argininosuccinate lyase